MAIDIQLYLSSDLRAIAYPSPGSDFTNSSLCNMQNRLELAISRFLFSFFVSLVSFTPRVSPNLGTKI